MDTCMKCGKELTQLDRGAYRKFVNRGSTSFLCKSCLAEKFGIEERVLDEKSSISGNRDARCLFNNEEKVPIMADCLQSRKHRKRFTEKNNS